ncbi:MAG: aldose 1-epimerase family protein [Rhizobium sp.]|nr:aldose 1-epimerase family protein [Rhizobium sp.]
MPDLVRIESDGLAVEVSSLGAEMQSLMSRDGRSWLWHGDPAFWGGRSPILFPIVGKAPDNRVLVDGRPFEMQQHGIARRSDFRLVDCDASSCLHEFASSEASRAAYPFDFRLTLRHAVEGLRLTLTAEVTNTGSRPLPFGLGFHPAFAWPLPGAAGREHFVQLDNNGEPELSRLEGGLRQPDILPSPFTKGRLVLAHDHFEDDAMIFPEGAGDGLLYGAEGGPGLKFRFDNLPNLALWTKPGAPFLCVEPWHGTAAEIGGSAELAARPYTVTLAKGASARFGFSVEISG